MRKPVGLVDRVASPDEDILHDQVEAAFFVAKNVEGIVGANLQAEAVEIEMGPGEPDHLGIEFHAHDFGPRRQAAKNSGDTAPTQAQ